MIHELKELRERLAKAKYEGHTVDCMTLDSAVELLSSDGCEVSKGNEVLYLTDEPIHRVNGTSAVAVCVPIKQAKVCPNCGRWLT